MKMTTPKPKLTLYVDETLRTRVKTAAAHSGQSISDFLLPFIEAALESEEEKMRGNLLQLQKPNPKPKRPTSSLPEVG